MKRFWAMICVLACALCLPACEALTDTAAQSDIHALFLNVGKADAALLFLGEQRWLVDTGTKDSYERLAFALDAYEVEKLDGVIITHTDKDHVGGLAKLLQSDVAVDAVYAGTLHSEKSLEKHPVYEATMAHSATLRWLSADDVIDLGNGCQFSVLGPITRDEKEENNNSLVMHLQTPHGSFLLTGDMEQEEEQSLFLHNRIPQAEVLKVAHHGRDDATSLAFVLLVNPQWSVISTSTEERPDSPDKDVLTRLYSVSSGVAVTQDAEVGIFITLQNGTATAQQIDRAR